jgi:hypothetical protein
MATAFAAGTGPARRNRTLSGEGEHLATQRRRTPLFAWRQFNESLSFAHAEMKMRLVLRDLLFRIEGIIDVDQKMVVATVRRIAPRLGNAMLRRPNRYQNAPLTLVSSGGQMT